MFFYFVSFILKFACLLKLINLLDKKSLTKSYLKKEKKMPAFTPEQVMEYKEVKLNQSIQLKMNIQS